MNLFYKNETTTADFEKYNVEIKIKIYNDLMNINVYKNGKWERASSGQGVF